MRGVKKQGVSTATTQFSGVFRKDANEQVRSRQMPSGSRASFSRKATSPLVMMRFITPFTTLAP